MDRGVMKAFDVVVGDHHPHLITEASTTSYHQTLQYQHSLTTVSLGYLGVDFLFVHSVVSQQDHVLY